MRVLVTGAAGSIGTVVVAGLLDRGHEVVGLDRTAATDGFPGRWYTVDCADPDSVAALLNRTAFSERLEAATGTLDLARLPGDWLSNAIAHFQASRHAFGHLVGVLEERLRATQAELAAVRQSYAQLLAQLYPPNEVYVVARAR